MHTFYKEHEGSYAVAIPWPVTYVTGDLYQSTSGWHVLFKGLSLPVAMRVVCILNGGTDHLTDEVIALLEECTA